MVVPTLSGHYIVGFFFMAFSSTDVSNIESAIVELATGARVVRASVGGRFVEYGQADLSKLTALLQLAKSDVAAGSTSGGMMRAVALKDVQ